MRSLLVVCALVLAPAAAGAVPVAGGATAPALRVDAAGNAAVMWTSSGARHTRIVLGRDIGADVSAPVRGSHIPFQAAIRLAGGWFYALQARGGKLRFSRWRGTPTEVSLIAATVPGGVRLTGRAMIGAKALARGTKVLLQASVDGRWRAVATPRLDADGSFETRAATSTARTYRALVAGPGLAPDAAAVAPLLVLDTGR